MKVLILSILRDIFFMSYKLIYNTKVITPLNNPRTTIMRRMCSYIILIGTSLNYELTTWDACLVKYALSIQAAGPELKKMNQMVANMNMLNIIVVSIM